MLISFIGEAIGVMRKALVSTLRGDITAAFDPFHCELLNVSTKEEVTLEAVTAQLGAMFGGEVQRQASDLQAGSMRIGQRVVKVTDKGGGSQRKASALTEKQAVAMPAELPAALADVRSDATATDWCLLRARARVRGRVRVNPNPNPDQARAMVPLGATLVGTNWLALDARIHHEDELGFAPALRVGPRLRAVLVRAHRPLDLPPPRHPAGPCSPNAVDVFE